MFSAFAFRKRVHAARAQRPSSASPRRAGRPSLRRLEPLEPRWTLSAVTVINNNDTGAGSLRDAINQVNGSGGVDRIAFGLPAGELTITPATPLPQIIKPVTIDGTSQTGFVAGASMVVLDGSLLTKGSTDIGLDLAGGNSTVRGLVLNNFSTQIRLTTLGGDTLQGNFMGTDVTGSTEVANGIGTGLAIAGGSGGNTIGGTAAAARNLISGFNEDINVQSDAGQNNLIEGNFIGTDITGTKSLGAGTFSGLLIESGGNTVGGTSTLVAGNLAGAGNLISGNDGDGLDIFNPNPSQAVVDHNVVQGNFIGTDVTGTKALGNGLGPVGQQFAATHGVTIIEATNTLIGGTVAGLGNLISANSNEQVKIDGGSGTLVQGNKIGTDVTGTQKLGAGVAGVSIGQNEPSSGNVIGGESAGAGNIIAFSDRIIPGNNVIPFDIGGYGVWVASLTTGTGQVSDKNTISGNSIFSNKVAGIKLDVDANNNQLSPSLTSASTSSAGTVIEGTLTSTPNSTFTAEFFSYPSQDPASATGQTYLGSSPAATDATGHGQVFFSTAASVPVGQFVTATVTDLSGNTSQFSNVEVVSTAVTPPPAVTGYRIDVPTTAIAGDPFTVTVTALDASNHTVTGYTGTVHFATTSPKFSLPSDYTFTAGPGGDDGVHVFTNAVSLNSVGSRTLSVSDTSTGSTSPSAPISVGPNVATQLSLAIPAPAEEATPQDLSVTALDEFGNTATGYKGTIGFSSNDTSQLPGDYTFTSGGSGADNGSHTIAGQVVIDHLGSVTITAADRHDATIKGSLTVNAGPGPAAEFVITGAPSTVQPFQPLTFTVTARDALHATVSSYIGHVIFSSPDTAATLGDQTVGFPVNISQNFVATDNISLGTPGQQTLTVSDKNNPAIHGSTTINVAGPPFPARISGHVFDDVFLDDLGGPGLPNRRLYLDINHDGKFDPGDPSVVTDSAGNFTFANVSPGQVTIRQVAYPGTTARSQANLTETVTPGETITGVDFADFVTNPVVPLNPLEYASPVVIFVPANTYVDGLYQSLLGRHAESSGEAFWAGVMNGSGAAAVARAIWESNEHRAVEVDSYYATYLQRPADPAGRAFWIKNLLGGASEAAVADAFVTAPEFLALHPDPTSLHAALAADILGQEDIPISGDLSTPAAAATAYLSADVKNVVDSYYTTFLHRPADPAESFWLAALGGEPVPQLKLEDVGVSILASAECLANITSGKL